MPRHLASTLRHDGKAQRPVAIVSKDGANAAGASVGQGIGTVPCEDLHKIDDALRVHPGLQRGLLLDVVDSQPLVPRGVQHQPGHQPVAGLTGQIVVTRGHVGKPLFVAGQGAVEVDVGHGAT